MDDPPSIHVKMITKFNLPLDLFNIIIHHFFSIIPAFVFLHKKFFIYWYRNTRPFYLNFVRYFSTVQYVILSVWRVFFIRHSYFK